MRLRQLLTKFGVLGIKKMEEIENGQVFHIDNLKPKMLC